MRRLAAFALVAVVLIGPALAVVAPQDGPPDHAGDPGPPDHAIDPDVDDDEHEDDERDGDDEDDRDENDDREDEDDSIPSDVAATPTDAPLPTATPTPTPERTTAPTPERDDGDGNGDDGSGSSGSTGRRSTPADPGPSVDVTVADDATTATVTDVDEAGTVSIPLHGPAVDGDGVAVSSVEVRVREGAPFTLSVSRPTRDGDGVDPPTGVGLAYFEVETDLDTGTLAHVRLAVEVEATLPADSRPGDVEVLRYADGEWRSTRTAYDGETERHTVEASEGSRFAVAVPEAEPLEVVEAEVPADWVRSGHALTARATVENPGDRPATETLAVTLDGERVTTRNVTVDAGETTTVAFEVVPERTGHRSVAVGGVDAGEVRVAEPETSTATDRESDRPVFGLLAAAFVVVAALGTALLAAGLDER